MKPKQCVVCVDRYIECEINDDEDILKALEHINYPIPPGVEGEDLFDIYEDQQYTIEEHFGEYIKVNIYDTNLVYDLFLDKFLPYKNFGGSEETFTEIFKEVEDFWTELENELTDYMGVCPRFDSIYFEYDGKIDSEIDLE